MITPSAVVAVTSSSSGTRRGFDDQRVVAGGDERVGQPGEDPAPVVVDGGRLAVHERGGGDDPPAVDLADGLVAEADPEDGELAGQLSDDGVADAGVVGAPGPR